MKLQRPSLKFLLHLSAETATFLSVYRAIFSSFKVFSVFQEILPGV
ncbi:MAG: hypothetical protein RIB86_17590 [Imperialibacter sp.]